MSWIQCLHLSLPVSRMHAVSSVITARIQATVSSLITTRIQAIVSSLITTRIQATVSSLITVRIQATVSSLANNCIPVHGIDITNNKHHEKYNRRKRIIILSNNNYCIGCMYIRLCLQRSCNLIRISNTINIFHYNKIMQFILFDEVYHIYNNL